MMHYVLILGLVLQLSACSNLSRLSSIGKVPPLSPMQHPSQNPGDRASSRPVSYVEGEGRHKNSLWSKNARSIFTDQRARQVGDILTVTIDIKDTASIKNESSRGRQNGEKMGVPNFFGYQGTLTREVLPPGVDPSKLVGIDSSNSNKGKGEIKRNEQISLRVAALITEVLPNGNYRISGKQQVVLNYERRDVTIDGFIRPEDVSPTNTISYDKIAEARISYGGKGQISDVQQPRYGQQVLDVLLPF